MLFVSTCTRVAAGSHLLGLLFFSPSHIKAFLVSALCLFVCFSFLAPLFLLSVVSYLPLCLISFVIPLLICIILYYLFPFLWHLFFLFLFFISFIPYFIPLLDFTSFLCFQLFPSSLAFHNVLYFAPFPLSDVFVNIFFSRIPVSRSFSVRHSAQV